MPDSSVLPTCESFQKLFDMRFATLFEVKSRQNTNFGHQIHGSCTLYSSKPPISWTCMGLLGNHFRDRIVDFLFSLFAMEVHKILDHVIAEVLVDDPVHELEASESDGEHDPTVLVNVRSRHTEHLVQFLHVTVRIGRDKWGHRRWRRTRVTGRPWRTRSTVVLLLLLWRGWQGRWCFFVEMSHPGR